MPLGGYAIRPYRAECCVAINFFILIFGERLYYGLGEEFALQTIALGGAVHMVALR